MIDTRMRGGMLIEHRHILMGEKLSDTILPFYHILHDKYKVKNNFLSFFTYMPLNLRPRLFLINF